MKVAGQKFRKTVLLSLDLAADSNGAVLANRATWASDHINGLPAVYANLQLKTLQNNLLLATYTLLRDWQAIMAPEVDDPIHYEPLITMDRTHVKPGEKIQVTVGVMAYRHLQHATMKLNGIHLKPDAYGRFSHALVAQRPGMHDLDLVVEYERRDGAIVVLKTMRYYVQP